MGGWLRWLVRVVGWGWLVKVVGVRSSRATDPATGSGRSQSKHTPAIERVSPRRPSVSVSRPTHATSSPRPSQPLTRHGGRKLRVEGQQLLQVAVVRQRTGQRGLRHHRRHQVLVACGRGGWGGWGALVGVGWGGLGLVRGWLEGWLGGRAARRALRPPVPPSATTHPPLRTPARGCWRARLEARDSWPAPDGGRGRRGVCVCVVASGSHAQSD